MATCILADSKYQPLDGADRRTGFVFEARQTGRQL
jgi:hypothetical protein